MTPEHSALIDKYEALVAESAHLRAEVGRLESYAKDRDNDARGMTRLCEQYREGRDVANLQNERYQKALEDIRACHAASSEPTYTRMVNVIAEAALRYRASIEKPKCEHLWSGGKMVCSRCGAVEDRYSFDNSPGVFCLDHRKVMVDGVCPKCAKKRKCLHERTEPAGDDMVRVCLDCKARVL